MENITQHFDKKNWIECLFLYGHDNQYIVWFLQKRLILQKYLIAIAGMLNISYFEKEKVFSMCS